MIAGRSEGLAAAPVAALQNEGFRTQNCSAPGGGVAVPAFAAVARSRAARVRIFWASVVFGLKRGFVRFLVGVLDLPAVAENLHVASGFAPVPGLSDDPNPAFLIVHLHVVAGGRDELADIVFRDRLGRRHIAEINVVIVDRLFQQHGRDSAARDDCVLAHHAAQRFILNGCKPLVGFLLEGGSNCLSLHAATCSLETGQFPGE
jgi:hypothetical protein